MEWLGWHDVQRDYSRHSHYFVPEREQPRRRRAYCDGNYASGYVAILPFSKRPRCARCLRFAPCSTGST